MSKNISSKIIYETPLNERIRTLLRVEHLMNQFYFFKENEDQWGVRCSIDTLLEILELFSRKNIKNELLKELERQLRHLQSISKVSEINNDKLNSIIESHNTHLEKINALENKLKTQMDRLNAIGGLESIVPSEGIVFKYKGKTYKFTGAFAPINQITGLIYF